MSSEAVGFLGEWTSPLIISPIQLGLLALVGSSQCFLFLQNTGIKLFARDKYGVTQEIIPPWERNGKLFPSLGLYWIMTFTLFYFPILEKTEVSFPMLF